MEHEALLFEHLLHAFQLQFDHLSYLFLRQRVEGDDVIDAVQELRTHQMGELFACSIARHDDDCVLKVHQTAFVIGQSSVVKYLQ